ncbi:MAG: bifunctional serine/threonine-protein kinase/formylglycine-generating enzyme family protein [Planctomycetota bacterium]
MSQDPSRSARDAFLELYLEDLRRDRLGELATYQARFPGFEADIAAEWALLEDEGEPASEDPDLAAAGAAGDVREAGEARRLGQYRILEELGRGGQAVVFLAVDERLGRRVALKVLRGSAFDMEDSDALHRFRREAEVSARLDHPGICSVYEAGEAEGLPFIAMRYVEGETLARKILRSRDTDLDDHSLVLSLAGAGGDPVTEVVDLVGRCARALHFAHEQGLVHRDVKPGNVIVTGDGEPVLCDFGLARVEAEEHGLTGSGVLMGTPYYMAPEQVRGEAARVDRRSDVWALGVTLYECLTLQRPFEAASREALYHQILLTEPRPLRSLAPRLSRDLQVIVEKAMAKEPDRRYATALQLAEDLRRVLDREPIVARPAGPLLRTWRWAQRRPAVASLSLLLLLVLCGGLLVMTAKNRELADRVAEFTELADMRRVDETIRRLDALPAWRPDHAPALAALLVDARALVARLPVHRGRLARLDARGGELGDVDAWQRTALVDLIAKLEDFERRQFALLADRLARVRDLAHGPLDPDGPAWRAAVARVGAAGGRYGGLAIPAWGDLVPLGPDPSSGLEEFAVHGTGDPPRRDASGRLAPTGAMAVVLVLVPGGPTRIGSRLPDDEHPVGTALVDALGLDNEHPPQDLVLAPYYLSKFELSQGQWLRMTRENPSGYPAGTTKEERSFDLRQPVDTVNWHLATEKLRVYGLDLPTEAQWEHGARGGTTTPWWFGEDPAGAAACGNVVDRSFLARHPLPLAPDAVEWGLDDGYELPAPIGSFRANPFGLFDVVGNLGELCRDEALLYRHRARPGDGLRLPPVAVPADDRANVVIRGGDNASQVRDARSAARAVVTSWTATHTMGLRPARRLAP